MTLDTKSHIFESDHYNFLKFMMRSLAETQMVRKDNMFITPASQNRYCLSWCLMSRHQYFRKFLLICATPTHTPFLTCAAYASVSLSFLLDTIGGGLRPNIEIY